MSGFKVGDRVFVVRTRRDGTKAKGNHVVVATVGAYGRLENLEQFSLGDGHPHPDSGIHFRVYASEEVYLTEKKTARECRPPQL